jgi:hypothetical protein
MLELELFVHPDLLTAVGHEVGTVADNLQGALAELRSQLADLAVACGRDELGKAAHDGKNGLGATCGQLLDSIDHLGNVLNGVRSGTGTMLGRYAENEAAIESGLQRLGSR